MKNNVIPTRIVLYLKQYPPFSLLSDEDLLSLAEQVKVCYHQAGDYLFEQGDDPQDQVYFIQEGAVHLLSREEDQELLVEVCDEGDLFGLRPLLAEQQYQLSARVAEESLIYAFALEGLKALMAKRPKISMYLAQTFAAGIQERVDATLRARQLLQEQSPSAEQATIIEVQSMNTRKPPVTCHADTRISDAAILMRQQNVGSLIVVNSDRHPIGIITDKDLRNKVVTGDISSDQSVEAIMSSPVLTRPPEVTVAEVQMAMMKHRIHHLVLTEDGTPNSGIIGVLSKHDLLVTQGNNPAILIREIQRSTTGMELSAIRSKAEELLGKYLEQEVAIDFISEVMSEINDALIQRSIRLSNYSLKKEGIAAPDVAFCWLSLGSEGRKEQLLRTDQDNALVYADVPEEEEEAVKAYFLHLSEKVTDLLAEIGFEYCPADMMAHNPEWCKSLKAWKKQFSTWILTPTEQNVMFCTIFFDFRPVFGERWLSEAMAEHIFETIESDSLFLPLLSKNAIHKPPPLTFFRNFVVEKSGEHKDEFDIKARAMMPLADAARVLILGHRQPRINNTFRRFEYLAEQEPKNAELYQQAADAYELFMRYRAVHGLKHRDSGRFFNPAELTKTQRLLLRNGFEPIRELQTLIKVRHRVGLFM